MTQIMFEHFLVNKFYVLSSEVLALYASGRSTGVVFSSGDGVSHIVPVYEGYTLPHAIMRTDVGGRDITDHLSKLLNRKGLSLATSADREIVRDIKEKFCFVAHDYDEELARTNDELIKRNCALPDGKVIEIRKERFQATEGMFRPSVLGFSREGMHQQLYNAIMRVDTMDRREFYRNIVLFGCNTMFPGLRDRLWKEMNCLAPNGMKVCVEAPEGRQYADFVGASILTSLETYAGMWITKEEYEEHGPAIVHRKCFS